MQVYVTVPGKAGLRSIFLLAIMAAALVVQSSAAGGGQGSDGVALAKAVQLGAAEEVRRLLEAGSDPDAADDLGDTSVHHAVSGKVDVLEMLLRAGANPNARNAGGISPLMLAYGAGRTDVITRLRKAGARVDVLDYGGGSAYDWALRGGHVSLAESLKQEITASQRGIELNDDGTSFADDASVRTKYPGWFKTSFYDLPDDLIEAREAGKQGIMLFISAERCSYCQAFMDTSLKDPLLQQRLRDNFDVIGMDIFDDSEMVALNGGEYRVKQFVLLAKASNTPTMMFFGEGGRLLARVVGYYPPKRFGMLLDFLESRAYRTQHWRDYLALQNKPASAVAPIARDAMFESPPHMLDRTVSAADRPLMVVFESEGCEACQRFHRRVLADKSIRRLLMGFDLVQLDAYDDGKKLVAPAGVVTTPRAWYRELDLSYFPAVVFFDEGGQEIMRLDSEILRFRMEGTLQMVLDGVGAEDAQLQRWRRTKVIESLQKGAAM
ncbi:MAG: thioredoxin fold domain-containing protein [Gammaproteobacteria bacterium]|nr:thioredoxin fold domain-containing protein [Gammaproteobacteria bacterium]